MRVTRFSKKGFSIVEVLVAMLVILGVITSMSSLLISLVQTNYEQKLRTVAQNLAVSLMNKEIRNKTFDTLYTTNYNSNSISSLNESNSQVPYLTVKTLNKDNAIQNLQGLSNTMLNIFKVNNAKAEVRISQIKDNESFSDTKINATVIVTWDGKFKEVNTTSDHKVEISTVVTKNGIVGASRALLNPNGSIASN